MKVKFSAIIDFNKAIEAVKQDGYALQYVKDQTEAICIEAVKQDGDALRYVKDQTEAVCIEAVKRKRYALQYILTKELFISIALKLNIQIEV